MNLTAATLRSPGRFDPRRERFASLYREHHEFVWRALRRLGLRDAAAEDAAQEVWLVAYRRLEQLGAVATARPWLFTIARRVVWRQRRTRARADRKHLALAHDPGAATASPGASLEVERSVDVAAQVDRYLARLPRDQCRVFLLAELLSMTAREIAAALEIKPATVYSRLRLARERLDAMLVADGAGEREQLVAAVRRGDAPGERQGERGWALLAPSLGAAPGLAGAKAAGVVAWIFGSKAIVGGLAVVGAAILTIAAVDARRRAPGPARDSAATRAAVASPGEVATADAATTIVARTPTSDGEERPATAPVSVAAARPRSIPTSTSTGRSTASLAAARSAGDDALARETELLVAARQALLEADPGRALGLLDRHAEAFATSALGEVREASRVQALCALGREAEAIAAARDIERGQPRSAAARVASTGCAALPTTAPRR